MKNSIITKIPNVEPSQFDEYLFSNWKAPVYKFYDKFHIERIENYKQHLILPTSPHRRSVNFFVFLTKGKFIRNKGLNSYEVEPNHFFFIPAFQITALEYVSDDAEGYYCHFSTDIFNNLQVKIDLQKDLPFFQTTSEPLLKVDNAERIIQLLAILEKENHKEIDEHLYLIALYLYTLLTDIKYQIQPQINTLKDAPSYLTQRYKNALSEHIYEKKTVAEYADFLSVTPNHLHKSVKATTGKSAHELLDDMKILEAKVLLKQTNLSIGEIAFKIGKFDPSDFSRFFKLNTKITPFQYRNQ